MVHAGTAVSTRTRGGEANSYNLVRLDGEWLEVVVMNPEDRFVATERAAYVLRAGGWIAAPAGTRAG